MKQNIKVLALLIILSVFGIHNTSCHAQEYRDVVYLKNGSVIKGFYKSFVMNDTLRMETLDGSLLVCPTSDIVRIAKERTDVYVIQRDEEETLEHRWRPKGYSGSVELISTFNVDNTDITSTGFSTTHGYHFNRHLFLGAGLGYETYTIKRNNINIVTDKPSYSFFTEGRWYVMHTRIAPVISCRAGYAINGFRGAFVAPGIGADFGISPRFGGFVRFQYRWKKYRYLWKDVTGENPDVIIEGNASSVMLTGGIHF